MVTTASCTPLILKAGKPTNNPKIIATTIAAIKAKTVGHPQPVFVTKSVSRIFVPSAINLIITYAAKPEMLH